jgi:hypothetical protein
VKTRKDLEKFQASYHQNLSSIKASEGSATILNQERNLKFKIGFFMKRHQVVVSQATKNPSRLSNLQPMTTSNLQKQRKIINCQGGVNKKVSELNL